MTKTLKPRRKRILYIDQTAAMSGGELALLSLIRELDKSLFDPTVILFEDGPFAAKLSGLADVVVLPLDSAVQTMRKEAVGGSSSVGLSKVIVILRYMTRLVRTIYRLKPDLIHTNSLKADILGGIAARILRVPLIWHVRDRIADDYLPHRAVLVFRKLCRILPTYIIANSQATLETLFLPNNKTASVITSGFDVSAFQRAGLQRESLAERVSLGKVIDIGIVGRISPWKGQDIFLRAAALVKQKYPQVRYSIIGAALFGETEHEETLRALVEELDLQAQVTFMGFRDNVSEAIGNLDILVHASVIPEPLGQVIAQGMAAGKPVVATRGGGASEIVNDGVTGWLVAPGDPEEMAQAIICVLKDPDAAGAVARHAQSAATSSFNPRQIALQVEQIYHSLLQ